MKNLNELPVRPNEGLFLGPVVFSPSLSLNLAYDDNVFKVEQGYDADGTGLSGPQTAQADTLLTTRARLALKLPFSHSFVSLVYTPQYSQYADLSTPRKTSHQAAFLSVLNFSNGSTLRLRDDFGRGFFEARRLDTERAYLLSATPYRRNTAGLDYDWTFARFWGVAGSLERTDYAFERTELVDFRDTSTGRGDTIDGLFDFFDYESTSIETRAYRNFPRFQVFASATLGRTDQNRTKFNASQLEARGCIDPPDPDTPEHQRACRDLRSRIPSEEISQRELALGIKGSLWPRSTANFHVGHTQWHFQKGATEPFSGLSLQGNLEHRFNNRTVAIARVERTVTQATGDITGYYVRQDAAVSLERRLTMRLTTALGLNYRSRHYPGSDESEQRAFTFKDYYGYLEARYRPATAARNGAYQIALAYAPQLTVSDVPGLGSRANRVLLTFQYGWF